MGAGWLFMEAGRKTAAQADTAWLSLTLPGFEGHVLETSQSGHLSQPKEKPSMLALDRQPLPRYAVPGCSGTGTRVTSAYTCGSSVLQILRDRRCESLKCHLLFMESQQTLKAWTLATNRDGGFFAFEVAKSKEQSMETSRNANCSSHLYDVDGCPLGAEMRLISSRHKQPQNGNCCCHLTFIHYQPYQSW